MLSVYVMANSLPSGNQSCSGERVEPGDEAMFYIEFNTLLNTLSVRGTLYTYLHTCNHVYSTAYNVIV